MHTGIGSPPAAWLHATEMQASGSGKHRSIKHMTPVPWIGVHGCGTL